jgi:hypothetical protein
MAGQDVSVSSREVVAFEDAFLGAIARLVCRSTNNGRQMLGPTDKWLSGPKQWRVGMLWCSTIRRAGATMLLSVSCQCIVRGIYR